QIYFMNGSVTQYVYTASGQKLRTVHYTAKPNISRTWGVKPAELTSSQILQADSTDYLLGGSLTLKNGKVDKYLFDGGYAQASAASSTSDNFTFYYYTPDHLGNIREVVNESGSVQQITNYYPFGATYAESSAADFQPYKYNGKELDKMHGLNTYDYGARQHDPILARWDRIDPLCEKYYGTSPYVYCVNNPVVLIDPDGRSTQVKILEDGTYQVIGGDINDKDRNIYVYTQDDDGNYTVRGESIGVSATMTSFYNSDKKKWENSIINPSDMSGEIFLGKIFKDPDLISYMDKARTNHEYDFKVTNGTLGKKDVNPYRGMPIGKTQGGMRIYSSARDIGNIAAGYVAAVNGLTWELARVGFDIYQGGVEGISTQNAEYYGWKYGKRSMPFVKEKFNSSNPFLIP
ncbi:RHS repeat-associated core domain-containing protein, partial [Xylanibacter ruminicola]